MSEVSIEQMERELEAKSMYPVQFADDGWSVIHRPFEPDNVGAQRVGFGETQEIALRDAYLKHCKPLSAEKPSEPEAQLDPYDTMVIYSEHGTKVVFLGQNGYEYQLEEAKKLLKVGGVYTVQSTIVDRSWSTVRLMEFPDKDFNTVLFGKYRATLPSEPKKEDSEFAGYEYGADALCSCGHSAEYHSGGYGDCQNCDCRGFEEPSAASVPAPKEEVLEYDRPPWQNCIYDYSNPETEAILRAERGDAVKVTGTFNCPLCGKDTPHEHTSEEVANYRISQSKASPAPGEEPRPHPFAFLNDVDRSHCFETQQVMDAIGAFNTEYARENIERHLHQLTSGERYTLYRGIKTLVLAAQSVEAEPKPTERNNRHFAECEKSLDWLIETVNGDHADRISFPRDMGCLMRDGIQRLRRVAALVVR